MQNKRLFNETGQYNKEGSQFFARVKNLLKPECERMLKEGFDIPDTENVVIHGAQMALILTRLKTQVQPIRKTKKK